MSKDTKTYTYKSPHEETDPHIKTRKCKYCKHFCPVSKMESAKACKTCYLKLTGKKRCNKCHLLKSTSSFYPNYMAFDGYKGICMECMGVKHHRKTKSHDKNHHWMQSNMNAFYYDLKKYNKNKDLNDDIDKIRQFYQHCPVNHRPRLKDINVGMFIDNLYYAEK